MPASPAASSETTAFDFSAWKGAKPAFPKMSGLDGMLSAAYDSYSTRKKEVKGGEWGKENRATFTRLLKQKLTDILQIPASQQNTPTIQAHITAENLQKALDFLDKASKGTLKAPEDCSKDLLTQIQTANKLNAVTNQGYWSTLHTQLQSIQQAVNEYDAKHQAQTRFIQQLRQQETDYEALRTQMTHWNSFAEASTQELATKWAPRAIKGAAAATTAAADDEATTRAKLRAQAAQAFASAILVPPQSNALVDGMEKAFPSLQEAAAHADELETRVAAWRAATNRGYAEQLPEINRARQAYTDGQGVRVADARSTAEVGRWANKAVEVPAALCESYIHAKRVITLVQALNEFKKKYSAKVLRQHRDAFELLDYAQKRKSSNVDEDSAKEIRLQHLMDSSFPFAELEETAAAANKLLQSAKLASGSEFSKHLKFKHVALLGACQEVCAAAHTLDAAAEAIDTSRPSAVEAGEQDEQPTVTATGGMQTAIVAIKQSRLEEAAAAAERVANEGKETQRLADVEAAGTKLTQAKASCKALYTPTAPQTNVNAEEQVKAQQQADERLVDDYAALLGLGAFNDKQREYLLNKLSLAWQNKDKPLNDRAKNTESGKGAWLRETMLLALSDNTIAALLAEKGCTDAQKDTERRRALRAYAIEQTADTNNLYVSFRNLVTEPTGYVVGRESTTGAGLFSAIAADGQLNEAEALNDHRTYPALRYTYMDTSGGEEKPSDKALHSRADCVAAVKNSRWHASLDEAQQAYLVDKLMRCRQSVAEYNKAHDILEHLDAAPGSNGGDMDELRKTVASHTGGGWYVPFKDTRGEQIWQAAEARKPKLG